MRVGVSHDFFAKGLKDYANWHWAWVRELCQNSIDCGSTEITFKITANQNQTIASCSNNGPPMDKDVLINKFMCLGGTTKTFEGTVGGFGIAKTVIALAHKHYTIHTGNYIISGSGGEFDLQEGDYYPGTTTTVVMEGDQVRELETKLRQFISLGQWSGTFMLNCPNLSTDMRAVQKKGAPRRELPFGTVYTNRNMHNILCVRINGIPMFTNHISLDRLVIVELNGRSDEVLTSNRDGLVNPYNNELNDFITSLAVDKRSALSKATGPKYVHYRGTKLCHKVNVRELVAAAAGASGRAVRVSSGVDSAVTGVTVDDLDTKQQPVYHEKAVKSGAGKVWLPSSTLLPQQLASLGTNFILKNETDLKIPAYYDPGSEEFSPYSRKLVRIWGRVLLELHRLFDFAGEFSVGFIFSDDTEAEYHNGNFGKVYYINPCKIVTQQYSNSQSFQKRFKLTERDRILAIAVHEFVHGLGYSWHDENYANKFTNMIWKVMAHRKRFNSAFQ